MSEPIPNAAPAPAPPEPSFAQSHAKAALRPQAGLRREGREAAIQFLFQLDFQPPTQTHTPSDQPVPCPVPDGDFWKLRAGAEDPEELSPVPSRAPIAPKARAFAESLVQGVWTHREALDELITRFSRNYRLSRLAAVDRNILRLAVYEILHNKEVPPVVAINEAIELAKEYGSEESGRFVNGLLDRIRAESPRAPRQAVRNRPEA
jgi:N utilization substance protein B